MSVVASCLAIQEPTAAALRNFEGAQPRAGATGQEPSIHTRPRWSNLRFVKILKKASGPRTMEPDHFPLKSSPIIEIEVIQLLYYYTIIILREMQN